MAKVVNLPTPEFSLIKINPKSVISDTRYYRGILPSGICFGSCKLDGQTVNLKENFTLSKLTKKNAPRISRDLLAIILFDIWLLNTDRIINNTNIVIQDLNDEKNLFAIDFVMIFNGRSYSQLEQELDYCPTVEDTLMNLELFDNVREYLGFFFDDEVKTILKNFGNINTNVINNIMKLIPETWRLQSSDKGLITKFLLHRVNFIKNHFDEILAQL